MATKRARNLTIDLNVISDEGLMVLYRMLKMERGTPTKDQLSFLLWTTEVKILLHERGIEVTF